MLLIGHRFLISVIQNYRHELMPHTEFQPRRRFVQNDLVERKTKTVESHPKKCRIQKKVRIRP